MGKTTNRYEEDFKEGAVALVIEKKQSISKVAKDLDISEPSLRRWVQIATEPEASASKKISDLEAEVKKLKKDLENANETVSILKKSVRIFVEP
jgi:transposase